MSLSAPTAPLALLLFRRRPPADADPVPVLHTRGDVTARPVATGEHVTEVAGAHLKRDFRGLQRAVRGLSLPAQIGEYVALW